MTENLACIAMAFFWACQSENFAGSNGARSNDKQKRSDGTDRSDKTGKDQSGKKSGKDGDASDSDSDERRD